MKPETQWRHVNSFHSFNPSRLETDVFQKWCHHLLFGFVLRNSLDNQVLAKFEYINTHKQHQDEFVFNC